MVQDKENTMHICHYKYPLWRCPDIACSAGRNLTTVLFEVNEQKYNY